MSDERNGNASSQRICLPKPDADNITVLTDSLPNDPVLPWHHFDSPWLEDEEGEEKADGSSIKSVEDRDPAESRDSSQGSESQGLGSGDLRGDAADPEEPVAEGKEQQHTPVPGQLSLELASDLAASQSLEVEVSEVEPATDGNQAIAPAKSETPKAPETVISDAEVEPDTAEAVEPDTCESLGHA